LLIIEQNLREVRGFLFRGTKEGPCVGEDPYPADLYPLERDGERVKRVPSKPQN